MTIDADKIVEFFKSYLEKKPFTDLLLLIGIVTFVWVEHGHREDRKLVREAFFKMQEKLIEHLEAKK